MPKTHISRRTVLKGLLGGFAVAVALPPLEIFMNSNGTAYAGNSAFPARFGIWFWGNGVVPVHWVPDGMGPDWTPSQALTPLASLKPNLTVISGMHVATANTDPHGSGPAGMFTGDDKKNGTYVGPSIDQIIAAEIGGGTRFRSLEVGVERSNNSISTNGPNAINPPETSPRALYNRLFGDGFRAPGDMSKPDPKVGLRRSVLDAVGAQSMRLRTKLGASDRVRLDQHLAGVRALEMQLDQLEKAPANLAACARPGMPAADYPDIEGREQLSAVSRVMSDMIAMALACDQTRVFTNMFSQSVNNVLFGNAPEGHHQLTHDELGDQPQVSAIVVSIVQELAYFLEALRKIPEGDGTLLDHAAVIGTTDCSLGRTHSLEEYPMVIAGTANGALKTGFHYRPPVTDNMCKVMLSLLRAFGVHAQSWGVGPGMVTAGLSAIEV